MMKRIAPLFLLIMWASVGCDDNDDSGDGSDIDTGTDTDSDTDTGGEAFAGSCTTVGAEGLPLAHGEQILFADDERAFTDRVIELLRNREQRRQLGDTARRYVYEHFRWEKVAEVFLDLCKRVAKG